MSTLAIYTKQKVRPNHRSARDDAEELKCEAGERTTSRT